jgi:hypothetical protein
MAVVTYEQANLVLHLYEMRREPRLREARAWFASSFNAQTPEEMAQKYPPGSDANTNVRMVLSYWEMAAGMVNRGLVDDDFFFENAGEAFFVYDRIRTLLPGMRANFHNPHVWSQLEALGKRMEAWQEKRAPGAVAAMREMTARRLAAAAKAAE